MTSGPTPSSDACWKLLSKERVFIGEISTRLVLLNPLHILLLSLKLGLLFTRLKIRRIPSLLAFEITKSSPWNTFSLKMLGEV